MLFFFSAKEMFSDMFSYLNLLDHVLSFICLCLLQEPALGKKKTLAQLKVHKIALSVRHTTWLPYKVMRALQAYCTLPKLLTISNRQICCVAEARQMDTWWHVLAAIAAAVQIVRPPDCVHLKDSFYIWIPPSVHHLSCSVAITVIIMLHLCGLKLLLMLCGDYKCQKRFFMSQRSRMGLLGCWSNKAGLHKDCVQLMELNVSQKSIGHM